ncbi:MAG: DNA cytosine methyltransferase [Gammaproteobacteria bacterium]|nr:DNA cytosine methyltransferase [Gammaproteobacteria bacterium]
MVGIDLFAGAGGLSLGAMRAGVNVTAAVELDCHAVATYRKNHPQCTMLTQDVSDITNEQIRSIPKERDANSIIFGGPPCQGFSYSNSRTRSVNNTKNWLFEEFIRFVRVWEPDFIVFENVRGITNTSDGLFLSEILKQFTELQYVLTYGVLNAKDYGVPQDRARFFLLGTRRPIALSLPPPTSVKSPTVEDAIADLPTLTNGASTSWLPYGEKKPSAYANALRSTCGRSPNHLVTRNAVYVQERYSYIPQGGNWQNIPCHLMHNYEDFTRCHTGIYSRLRLDKPSNVIGNYRKNMLIHPTQDRGLSVREAARIQSFPDSYEFCGSIGFQQQQVGNAVPPLLAESVFSHLISQAEH